MEQISDMIRKSASGAVLKTAHFDPAIRVEVKSIYGRDTTYVVSPHAEHIAALTGKKTVDKSDLDALKALGFQVYNQTGKTWN